MSGVAANMTRYKSRSRLETFHYSLLSLYAIETLTWYCRAILSSCHDGIHPLATMACGPLLSSQKEGHHALDLALLYTSTAESSSTIDSSYSTEFAYQISSGCLTATNTRYAANTEAVAIILAAGTMTALWRECREEAPQKCQATADKSLGTAEKRLVVPWCRCSREAALQAALESAAAATVSRL